MKIQTIALWQPYATLFVLGIKKIETRGYYTARRGRLIIHASKMNDKNRVPCQEAFMRFYDELSAAGYEHLGLMPQGALVGEVNLIDSKMMVSGPTSKPFEISINSISSKEQEYGWYEPGRHAWMAKDPIKYEKPIPYVGQQGFFNVDASILPL